MNRDAAELSANFDLEKLTPEFYANPYPTYRALRENEPVKRLPNGSYFLTRYDDLVAAYKATKVFSSDKKKEFFPKSGDCMLFLDQTTSIVFIVPPAQAPANSATPSSSVVRGMPRMVSEPSTRSISLECPASGT